MQIKSHNDNIKNEDELRKIIKPYPTVLNKRIQPTLDKYSVEFILLSSIAAVTFQNLSLGMPLLNLKKSSLSIDSNSTLSFFTKKAIGTKVIHNTPCSLYFLIPGIGHGLRINGEASEIKSINKETDVQITLNIKSVYLHCARAITRAGLWGKAIEIQKITVKSIIENSPYALLSTQDANGNTELSPRGDPKGFVNFIDDNRLILPERPGNRVAVSLRNIINNPIVGLCFLVPGLNTTAYLEGHATIITDQSLLKPSAIKGKIPKLGISITIKNLSLCNSEILEGTKIWDSESHVSNDSLTSFSKALTAHMQGEGLLGSISNPIISGIIKHDMKNLY